MYREATATESTNHSADFLGMAPFGRLVFIDLTITRESCL